MDVTPDADWAVNTCPAQATIRPVSTCASKRTTHHEKILMIVAALLALSLATGCASMADAIAARGTGTARVYDQPYDTV
jgi:hypothetical protein